MSTTLRNILVLVFLIAVGGGIAAYLMWNQSHRDLSETVDYTLKPSELYQAFSNDESSANKQYLNKVVEMTGVVMEKQEIEGNRGMVLLEVPNEMFGINCAFEPEAAGALDSVNVGDQITLRGAITGYTMDVNLARCILMN